MVIENNLSSNYNISPEPELGDWRSKTHSSISTIAEQSQKIAELNDQKNLKEATDQGEKIKTVGENLEKASSAVGTIAGAVVGTVVCPALGTAAGAALGGAIGKLGGALNGAVFDAIGNKKIAAAEEKYGDGHDIAEASENAGEFAGHTEQAFSAFQALQAERNELADSATTTDAASLTGEATALATAG